MTGLDRSALDAMQERADAARTEPWRLDGAHYAQDVPALLAENARLRAMLDTATSARDTYARQVGLARAEERAQWDRAERAEAALAEVRALAERGTGTDLTPTRMHLSTAQDDLWWCGYLARLDTAWRDHLRAILDRHQGGEA